MDVVGTVVKGDCAAGPCYGFPTANIEIDNEPDLARGVYVGHADISESEHDVPVVICYGVGILNDKPKFEFHILDWAGDLYGKHVQVHVGKMINGIVPFFGVDFMRSKIKHDMEVARKELGLV